jgi:tRNA U54 and U55 pseudouridine synthase Pus10
MPVLDRQKPDLIVFECDYCDDTIETGTADFDDAMEKFRDEGWHSRKVGGDWKHACPKHEKDLLRDAWQHQIEKGPRP